MCAIPLSLGADLRRARQPKRIPQIRLKNGPRYVDIVHDRRGVIPIFACVGQKRGSNEILFLGQFRSRPEAEAAARQFLMATNDYPPYAPAAEVAPIGASVDGRLQSARSLVESSRRISAGMRTLIEQSRELLRPRSR